MFEKTNSFVKLLIVLINKKELYMLVNKAFTRYLGKKALTMIEKDPEKGILQAINFVNPFIKSQSTRQYLADTKRALEDEKSSYANMVRKIFTELSPATRKSLVNNFAINGLIYGIAKTKKLKEKHGFNFPWVILMDPTSACNLKCTGCWAASYSQKSELDLNTLDNIIKQGKKLGIYFYIYSGGEPTIRKKDLLYLAKKHHDCYFMAFTNGTLVDKEFADQLGELGNFALAFSIEGVEEATDFRRGKGTYKKVIEGMNNMKQAGALFGFSTCYHSKNVSQVGNAEFLDYLIELGCKFGWYFTYIPIGKDATVDLLVTPDQREYMYHFVREMRATKPIFLMDFWNDGEYAGGCIAGARSYIHINANGDVEPCAFIHYANVNIKEVSLFEALKSPLFAEYKKNQPFNENHLRPCPLLDNPEKFVQIVNNSNAYSTEVLHKEKPEEIYNRTIDISRKWAIVADKLWKKSKNKQEEDKKTFVESKV